MKKTAVNGACSMPSKCGRTEVFRLPSLGLEIGVVFLVSILTILLPAPTERTVNAEYLRKCTREISSDDRY